MPRRNTAPYDLRTQLRAATQDVHDRLHEHPLTTPLLSNDLSQMHYEWVLFSFARFHEAIEDHWRHAHRPYAPNVRSALIHLDLALLGAPPNPLPQCVPPPLTLEPDAFWGCYYVIEGSALGGQVMAHHLGKTLQLHAHNGAAFFTGHGKETAAHWRHFLSQLQTEHREADRVIHAAQQTFLWLEDWLWQCWKRYHLATKQAA